MGPEKQNARFHRGVMSVRSDKRHNKHADLRATAPEDFLWRSINGETWQY